MYVLLPYVCLFFPEWVARVPVSLWGSGGLGLEVQVCSLDVQPSATVLNRSQPFATVRNPSCEGRMAVPIGSFQG